MKCFHVLWIEKDVFIYMKTAMTSVPMRSAVVTACIHL